MLVEASRPMRCPRSKRAPEEEHLPRPVVAADHQPLAGLVELVHVRREVGRDLGLQGRGQHPPRGASWALSLVHVGRVESSTGAYHDDRGGPDAR